MNSVECPVCGGELLEHTVVSDVACNRVLRCESCPFHTGTYHVGELHRLQSKMLTRQQEQKRVLEAVRAEMHEQEETIERLERELEHAKRLSGVAQLERELEKAWSDLRHTLQWWMQNVPPATWEAFKKWDAEPDPTPGDPAARPIPDVTEERMNRVRDKECYVTAWKCPECNAPAGSVKWVHESGILFCTSCLTALQVKKHPGDQEATGAI